MKILSIDVGSGDVKIASYINGGLNFNKEINAVAKLPSDGLINPDASEDLVNLNGQNYYVGKSALHIKKTSQFNTDSFIDIKTISPIVVKKYLNKYNDFDFIAFDISLAYMDKAEEFCNHIIQSLGLDPNKVVILPQGISCKMAYQWKGTSINGNTSANINSFLGVDIGFNSIDVFQVVNGKLTSESVEGIEKTGIVKIAQGIVDYCKSKGGDISIATAKEAILSKTVVVKGISIDGIPEELERLKKNYAEDTYNLIYSKFKDTVDVSQGIIFFGGGAELIREELTSDDFAKRHEIGLGFIQIPELPEYYNALGNIYYVLNRENAL